MTDGARDANRSRFRPYVWILLCCAIPGALIGLFWPIIGITACRGGGYSEQTYLAYCDSTGYGDYEHGAMWFDLEPEAIANLRRADVLVVGNSRMQVAFSTRAAREFAAAQGWRIYFLGFGYNEDSAFPKALIRRYHLRPRVIIINADPFFTTNGGDASSPSSRLIAGTDTISDYVRLKIKQWAQVFQRFACHSPQLKAFTCGGKVLATYRSRIDGGWDITDWQLPRTFPLSAEQPSYAASLPELIANAKDFLASPGIDESCVLFTVVPSNHSVSAESREVAKGVGVPLLAPVVDGLRTYDYSHLETTSAERWSGAFFQLAEPQIQSCLQRAAVSAQGSR